jgi:large subunit ribosomal protein L21
MFAVVRTGGKQYRVAPGDKIVVEKLDGKAGDTSRWATSCSPARAASLKSTDGLTVAAEIIAQAKADKVTVFKKRRRHNYRRKKGHRQQHTILKIVAIGDQEGREARRPPGRGRRRRRQARRKAGQAAAKAEAEAPKAADRESGAPNNARPRRRRRPPQGGKAAPAKLRAKKARRQRSRTC